jgi:hypothetical protein
MPVAFCVGHRRVWVTCHRREDRRPRARTRKQAPGRRLSPRRRAGGLRSAGERQLALLRAVPAIRRRPESARSKPSLNAIPPAYAASGTMTQFGARQFILCGVALNVAGTLAAQTAKPASATSSAPASAYRPRARCGATTQAAG